MTITGPQKSRTVRARDKAPVKPTKAGTKPGSKTKGPRTAARFEKDDTRRARVHFQQQRRTGCRRFPPENSSASARFGGRIAFGRLSSQIPS